MTVPQFIRYISGVLGLVIFSAMELSAQSMATSEEFRKVLKTSLKGVFVEGLITDSGVATIESVSLDLQGANLPNRDAKDLLPGYSITGIDENGVTRTGSLHVLSSYAWSGGDSHTWVAYFSTASPMKMTRLKIDGKKTQHQSLRIRYGMNKGFKSFEVGSGQVTWRTGFNLAEVLFSLDGGRSWSSSSDLRSSNGSIPLTKLVEGNQGETQYLLIASEKNTLYVQMYKVTQK